MKNGEMMGHFCKFAFSLRILQKSRIKDTWEAARSAKVAASDIANPGIS